MITTKERPTAASMYLLPSKLDKLTAKAFEKGYRSRNELIDHILTDWLKKEEKKSI